MSTPRTLEGLLNRIWGLVLVQRWFDNDQEELAEILENAIEFLDERDQLIIKTRYGLFGQRWMSARLLAEQLGISAARVAQLEHQAIRSIRERLARPSYWLGWELLSLRAQL